VGLPDTTSLLIGALAFMRIGAIMVSLPVFGDAPTPLRTRILLSMAITIGVFPTLPAAWGPDLNVDALLIAAFIIKEILVGLFIGYIARLAFTGLLMAAGLVSYQMGFGTSNLFMPDADGSMDSFSAFHRIVCMLIFLSLNLHYIFLNGIADSFTLIPGGAASFHGNLGEILITLSSGIFLVAVQLSAPVTIALLFTMAAMGLIARTVPQMNVFTLSFPASFFIGLAIYIATMPFFPQWMKEHYFSYESAVNGALRLMN
jgi:flagellar biosynthetic protein FliR